MIGVLVLQEPSQCGDQYACAGRRLASSQMSYETVEPVGRFGKPGSQGLTTHERPVGVALPASPAQAPTRVAA
jgi:hypothetical protein